MGHEYQGGDWEDVVCPRGGDGGATDFLLAERGTRDTGQSQTLTSPRWYPSAYTGVDFKSGAGIPAG